MGQTAGSIRSVVSTTVRAVYAAQGVAGDDPLKDVTAQLPANSQMTTLEYGAGSGYVDRTTVSNRAIPASSSVTYDLYTGTDLRGPAGETTPLRLVKYLEISVVSGGTSSGVRIGGASSNEWVGFFAAAGDMADLFPGGPAFAVGSPAGKAVGSTTKNLKIENLGTSEVVVRIVTGGSIIAGGYLMGLLGLTYSG
jgi:hypothetical protein